MPDIETDVECAEGMSSLILGWFGGWGTLYGLTRLVRQGVHPSDKIYTAVSVVSLGVGLLGAYHMTRKQTHYIIIS